MNRRYDRDELLRRTDLGALLDELSGSSQGHGQRARWHCPVPDHDDVHPSVTMRVDRRGVERWKCWSFGHGGTAIDALYYARGVNYQDALEQLAHRAGVAPGERGRRPVRPPLKPRASTPLQAPAAKYVEACERLLWEPVGRRVREYLVDERGLDPDVLRTNRVGADPGTSKLSRAGGLPRFGPGAVFPAIDADGQLVYFQTRYLDPHPDRSKYGNPASRHGDNPRHGWTLPVGDANDPVVVCEGFPDAYVANSAGYRAVAVLGTGNATDYLAEQLAPRLHGRPVLLALDGDDAGRAAAEHLRMGFKRCGIMVAELPLPLGMDLNSWVQSARQVPDLGRSARPAPSPPLTVAAPAPPPVPTPAIPGP